MAIRTHIFGDAQTYAVHLNAFNQIAIVCFGSRLLDCWFKRMLNYVTLGFILIHIGDEERKLSEIAVNQCLGSIESISFHELNTSKKIIVCNQNWNLFNNFQNFIYICMLCKKLMKIDFRK